MYPLVSRNYPSDIFACQRDCWKHQLFVGVINGLEAITEHEGSEERSDNYTVRDTLSRGVIFIFTAEILVG